MYKYSKVVYKLANGDFVKDYPAAVASGQKFKVEYVPVYEYPEIEKDIAKRRRSLY